MACQDFVLHQMWLIAEQWIERLLIMYLVTFSNTQYFQKNYAYFNYIYYKKLMFEFSV